MHLFSKLFGTGKQCAHCGGATQGYKCSQCGAEATTHDESHACGGNKCLPKCAACSEADANCKCPTPAK